MGAKIQTIVITRRSDRALNNTEVQSLAVGEIDVFKTDRDLPSPYKGFPADNIDTAGIELEDLFGNEDLNGHLKEMPIPHFLVSN